MQLAIGCLDFSYRSCFTLCLNNSFSNSAMAVLLGIIAIGITGITANENDCAVVTVNNVIGTINGPHDSSSQRNCWEFSLPGQQRYDGLHISVETNFSPGVKLFFEGFEKYIYENDALEPSCWVWTFNKTCKMHTQGIIEHCDGNVMYNRLHGRVIMKMSTQRATMNAWNDGRSWMNIKYLYIGDEHRMLYDCTDGPIPGMSTTGCDNTFILISVITFVVTILATFGLVSACCLRERCGAVVARLRDPPNFIPHRRFGLLRLRNDDSSPGESTQSSTD